MCCGCSNLHTFIGGCLYVFERLASCCAVASVVTCVITTLLIMLGLGIGLGYNYCFVDNKFPELNSGTTTPSDSDKESIDKSPSNNHEQPYQGESSDENDPHLSYPGYYPSYERKRNQGGARATTSTMPTRPAIETVTPVSSLIFSQIDPIIFMTDRAYYRGKKRRDFSSQYSMKEKTLVNTQDTPTATTELVLVVPLKKMGLMALLDNLIERNKNATLKLVASQ